MPCPNGQTPSTTSTRTTRDDGTGARLAALVRSSADAIVGETLEGIVTDWNPAAERLYGYRAEEIIGQPLTMLVPPERLAEAEDILIRARRGEHVADVETERWTKDGRRIDISLSVSPVWDDAGEIIATSAIVRDITKQKAMASALADSEALFRVAFENAPVGMFLTSPDGTTLRVNRALCTMLGYVADDLVATNAWAFTHPEDIEPNRTFMLRALAGEIDTYELEKRYLHKDGHSVWGHLSGSLVRDDAGMPRYFISQIQDITERKAAEAELVATHQHTRQVLERITDHFYALDRDWRLTYVNEATERLAGRPRQELLGKTIWDMSSATAREVLSPRFEQALASGEPQTIELTDPPRGTWYEVRVYPSANGLSVFFSDVTEGRRLSVELQDSEAKYRTLVEQLPGVVYLLADDEKQTPLYFSPYIEAVTGETPEVAMAFHDHDQWLDLVHPEDREWVAAEDKRSRESAELFRAEYRHRHTDGGYVWVRDERVPVRNELDQIVAWQGVMLDITDRIQAEEAHARLAALVESAEDAVVSSTLDGTITSWNLGAEKLYGYRAEEIIGQPFALLLPADLDDPLLEARRAAAMAGTPVAPFEMARQRRDGSTFAASIALSPIRDHTGHIIGVSSITRDITERKQLEVELRVALKAAEAANQAKSHFLAMTSHELRTPLQAVLGYAEFLLDDPQASLTAEQREDLGYIQHGGRRMLTLINQMLDLSRIEAGRLDLVAQPVDLASILEQVRQDVAPQAIQKGLELRIQVPATMPPVLGDAERLRQILLNLVGNAVKFTDSGSVEITTEMADGMVAVTVRDTGSGIAPQALPHIFEAFRQGDSHLARRHGGAGLGLAIAYKLAELMGGRITVDSALEVGSTFTLQVVAVPPTQG